MTQATEEAEYQLRASRILDAATELLLKFGYKRVTVEDIASRAGVGKGTVYLHWKTKRDVFAMVLLRDWARLVRTMLDAMRSDPEEIRLHRISRTSYRAIMSHPLSKALYTGDVEILGALAESDAPGFRHLRMSGHELNARYNAVLREHGLLRTDLDPVSQRYAINAAMRGFFAGDWERFSNAQPASEEKAEALAVTLRNAFEPVEATSRAQLSAAAAVVIALYEQRLAECEALLPRCSRTPRQETTTET